MTYKEVHQKKNMCDKDAERINSSKKFKLDNCLQVFKLFTK